MASLYQQYVQLNNAAALEICTMELGYNIVNFLKISRKMHS